MGHCKVIIWLVCLLCVDDTYPFVGYPFTDTIYVEDAPACFRRFATGRRLGDRYIRRTIATQSLRHCEELCAQEETFLCEGFNFRFDGSGEGRSSCQLTSVPSEHLDASHDFNADRDYDFFERDRNAPKSCSRPLAGLRPWTQYGSQRFHGVMGGYGGYGVGGYSMRHPPSDECFVRTRPGFKLDRNIVALAVSAPTLWHCETECANERKFLCNVFSYRYSQGQGKARDNCHMSERSFRSLDLYTDIVPDRDFDIYTRNEFGRPGCTPQPAFGSDCFERVRSGLGLNQVMTRLAMRVSSLQECEQACIHSRMFTCRAFSFRYSTPVIGQMSENCRLTDWPVPEMNPMKHLMNEPGCELYHRASYGHGCELDRWPFHAHQGALQPTGPSGSSGTSGSSVPSPPSAPFSPSAPFNPPAPYPPSAPSAPSAPSGPARPLPSRPTAYPPAKYPHYPMTSYGSPPGNSLNFGGPSGGGKVSSSSQWLGHSGTGSGSMYLPPSAYGDTSSLSTRPLDEFCYIGYNFPARLLPKAIHNSLYVSSEAACRAECTRARQRSVFRCASLSYRGTTCELSAIELRDLRPGYDFVHDREFRLFSWDFADARCYVPPSGTPPPPSGVLPSTSETWQRFTVSGRPCRSGTVCTMNWEIGIWTCPLDDGDWDYCCRSGHHCGYSDGYSYPWCYVGSSDKDQWRPCSEHYYPYFPQVDGRPLHWPVSYLHREGPPNMTVPQHQPSIVDNFLKTFSENQGGLFGAQGNDSAVPDLQPVDLVTQPPADSDRDDAMTKLWTWGQSKFNTSTGAPTEANSTGSSS